ncbi:MAG: hypothetical protein WBP34_12290 [Thermoanaerobaculia bacterium]
MITALRSVLGVIVGYLLMVLLITLVQEVWFGGVSFGKSPRAVLLIAGSLTFGAAVIGGMTATAIAGSKTRTVGVLMAGLVVIETTYLLAAGKIAGPLWFDLLGSGSLVAGILLGAEFLIRLQRRTNDRGPA